MFKRACVGEVVLRDVGEVLCMGGLENAMGILLKALVVVMWLLVLVSVLGGGSGEVPQHRLCVNFGSSLCFEAVVGATVLFICALHVQPS